MCCECFCFCLRLVCCWRGFLSLSLFSLANFFMQPPIADHVSLFATLEETSLLSGVDCSGEPDQARQEFKQEADINYLLRKYGAVPQRPVSYGEVDFDLDFQQARLAMREVSEGYARLSPEVRERYPTLEALLAAIANGEAVDLTPAPSGAGGGSPASGGAAASDSAPVPT